MDYTTLFCVNALSALNFGSCGIVNLFSQMTPKLDLSNNLADLTCPENNALIVKFASECDTFIWAVGSISTTYKKVRVFQEKLLAELFPFREKVHCISDFRGKENLHPLTPSLRNKPWELVPFAFPPSPADKTDALAPAPNTGKKRKEKDVPPSD
jgi:hypothetical protein